MPVQQTCGQRTWAAGACYPWGSHCPYLKISIRLCEIPTSLRRGGTHFGETLLWKGFKSNNKIKKGSEIPYQAIIQWSNQVPKIQTLEFRESFTKCGFYFHPVLSDLVCRCKPSIQGKAWHKRRRDHVPKGVSVPLALHSFQGERLCQLDSSLALGSFWKYKRLDGVCCFSPGCELKIHFFLHFKHHFSRTKYYVW